MSRSPSNSRGPSQKRRRPEPHGPGLDGVVRGRELSGEIVTSLTTRSGRGGRPRIGIVGGGISGLGCALALQECADVTVFEKAARPGGHAHTVDVDYDGVPTSVDVGFIVYNTLNYPNFTEMLSYLGVETLQSDMSFSVSDRGGLEWSSDPSGLFAWKRNAVNPAFLGLLAEIMRFNKLGCGVLLGDGEADEPLGVWLDRHGFSNNLRDAYLLPMGGAIWSTPEEEMLNYPVGALLSFFRNHRLMHFDRPKWRTVAGGSRNYVDALCAKLSDGVMTNSEVADVRPGSNGGVEVFTSDGRSQTFDQVVMANHANEALGQLDASFDEQRLALGSVRFSKNRAFLHRDASLMPQRKAAWASWNVLKGGDDSVCVTYWMNRLQKLDDERPLFLTLNPITPPCSELVFDEFDFEHPMYDLTSAAARRALQRVQGRDGLYFAGAWLGDGFHEAGLRSGLEAAYALGGEAPWEASLQMEHPRPQNLTVRQDQTAAL